MILSMAVTFKFNPCRLGNVEGCEGVKYKTSKYTAINVESTDFVVSEMNSAPHDAGYDQVQMAARKG